MTRSLLSAVLMALVGCSGGEPGEEASTDASSLADFSVKPQDGNHAPSLHKVGNKEVQVGQELSVALQADDPDGDTLTFSVYGDMPEGAKFFKPEGRFTWTPAAAGGPFFVTFVVSDMKDFDSETVELRAVTQTTQHAPKFTALGDQFLKVNKIYELRLEASDEDGDTLYFSVKGSIPSSATFDAANAIFQWAPTAADAGALVRVTFAVSDGSLSSEMEVRLIVEGGSQTNHPPEIQPIEPVNVEVGSIVKLEVKASDPDGDALTFSVQTPLPDGASFDPAAHVLTWAPSPAYEGKSVVVGFAVTDGAYTATQEATILVKAKGAACADDPYEPNNKTAEATAITQGTFSDLSICDTQLSPIDQDVFSLLLTANEHLEASITFLHAQGDLDLALFHSADLQQPVFYSPTVGDKEVVSYTAPLAGTYYLLVFGTGAGTYSVPYSMVVTRQSGSTCQPDALEPNDSVAGAKMLDDPQTSGSTIQNLSICPSDTDIYAVLLGCGQSLLAGITFNNAAGDLDLYLLDPSGAKTLDQSTTESGAETVFLEGSSVEDFYYVMVAGYPKESTQNTYALEVQVEEGGSCAQDAEEPNDGFGDPTVINATKSFQGLTLCCNEDWFSFPKGPGTVTVKVTPSDAITLDAAFVTPMAGGADTPLTCSFSGCSGTRDLPTGGGLYLRVRGTYGLTYDMTATIDTTGSTTGSCVGKCGADGGGCWCDEMCSKYGDCCPDACAACSVCP